VVLGLVTGASFAQEEQRQLQQQKVFSGMQQQQHLQGRSETSWTRCQADAQWMEGGWSLPQKDLRRQKEGRALQVSLQRMPGLLKLPIWLLLSGDLALGTAFLVST
jgi:hypothetical protein